MAPLATAWNIPLDWFFDGNDDNPPINGVSMPVGSTGRNEGGIPVRGELPARSDRSGPSLGTRPATVSFPLPANAEYRLVTDSALEPLIRKGDLALIVPDEFPRRDTIALISTAAKVLDLYHVMPSRTEVSRLSEVQPEAGSDWTQLGFVVQIQRTLAGGLIYSLECETGLTPDMLKLTQ